MIFHSRNLFYDFFPSHQTGGFEGDLIAIKSQPKKTRHVVQDVKYAAVNINEYFCINVIKFVTKDAKHVAAEHYKLFPEHLGTEKGRKRVPPRAQQLFLFTEELFSVPL